nr:Sec-independent protein translocase protein TatB [uncultured Kingella sp.]
MFDFSFTEMLLAGVVALIVLGPERLPKVARTMGEWVGKIQRLATGVKQELVTHGEYAELAKMKQDLADTAAEIKQDLHDFGKRVENETQEIARQTQDIAKQAEADTRPAWERLPEQKTPADFGMETDETGAPVFRQPESAVYVPQPPAAALQGKSLRKQAMARKRETRPRRRPPVPKLRSRR